MPEGFTDALHNVDSDSSGADSHSDHSDDDETSDLEELWEWQRIMCKPPLDASAPQLRSALGATQLAYSKLHIQMKQLQIDYNSLLSTLPQSHKKAVENNPNTILDNNIIAQAKKYCFFYHFWLPKDVFPLVTLLPGYDLTDPACWSMPESKITGFKAELYFMLPSNLKVHVTTYSNFGCVFSNAVGAERPNILKPVKDNTQQLFAHLELSADLFANENSRALHGSNEAVRVLLKMHPGNVDAHYTPLSPILFPKPDTLVARDLFKTPLLVNIIRVMKLGISGPSAGLIAIAATFAQYLLLSDRKLTTIGEESGFRYQDDFEYFIELLSHPSKQEQSSEVMEFFNQGVRNASSNASANAALGSSNDTSVASTWESNILVQLDGPQQPTPPPNLHFDGPNSTSISCHMPEATHGRAADLVVISQANSVSSALSVDISNLSLGSSHTSALPSISSRGRELPVRRSHSGSRMAEVSVAAPVNTWEPPAKEHHVTRCKGKVVVTMTDNASHRLGLRVDGKYRLGKKIALGTFGDIYLRIDITSSEEVAIKLKPGLKAATKKQKYDCIMEQEMSTPMDLLCCGFPNEFGIFLNYTQVLWFDNKPDYSYLRKLFHDLFICEGFQYDYIFDWSIQHSAPKDASTGMSQKASAGRRKVD
ncbi:hypothetical protein M404DRAFT_24360 [Pisolithus tinctorius Marx 270]|uniref:Uncharacterized protein n=1 Tax=Pisolithus tinctorius Marx 270 TaxID=870435 RepID=A0A0C3KAJ1_PISTI|nr:hypothetical protein M404DRAFT_24360 [Pisolithus tinctorius Marx 270]